MATQNYEAASAGPAVFTIQYSDVAPFPILSATVNNPGGAGHATVALLDKTTRAVVWTRVLPIGTGTQTWDLSTFNQNMVQGVAKGNPYFALPYFVTCEWSSS